MPQGALSYNSLTESQRATFEAIVHALYAQGIFAIVEEVTEIWGEDRTSDDGRDQFRVSVVLVEGAVEFLLAHRDYRKSVFLGIGLGHVKLPNGDVVGDGGADSVRQVAERRPELQISWLEADYTIGEIDIDYREGSSHTEAANSDVRASVGGELHLDLHRERYRRPPDIDAWWRR